MSDDVRYRRARPADLRRLAEADPAMTTDARRAEASARLLKLGFSWLAEAGGQVVGFVLVSDHFFSRPFVDLLVVAPSHRRRGLGRALMGKAEAAHGDDRLFTSTNESNAPMRALLAGRGYHVSGVIENLDPGDPELVFVKFRDEAGL